MKKLINLFIICIIPFILFSCSKKDNSEPPINKSTLEKSFSIKSESANDKADIFFKINSNNISDNNIILSIYIDDDLFIKETLSPNLKRSLNYSYEIPRTSHIVKIYVNNTNKFSIPFNNTYKNQLVTINYNNNNQINDVTATVSDIK